MFITGDLNKQCDLTSYTFIIFPIKINLYFEKVLYLTTQFVWSLHLVGKLLSLVERLKLQDYPVGF